jgi:hypothetical protein
MSRDLVATILDADESDFDVELEYVLPGDVGELVGQAKGARAWLDAAQDLWHERSVAAAQALTAGGYSLREAAALLGLSHQRVDQLLSGHADHGQSNVLVFEYTAKAGGIRAGSPGTEKTRDLDALLVVRRDQAVPGRRTGGGQRKDMEARFWEQVRTFVLAMSREVPEKQAMPGPAS